MTTIQRVLLIAAMGGLMEAVRSVAVAGSGDRVRAAATVLGIGFVLIVSHLVGKLFAQIRLPKLTGYLAAGIVSGPAVLAYLDGDVVGDMKLVNGVAIALIALTAGSEIDFRAMRPLFRSVAWISAIAVCGTALALSLAALLLRPFLPFLAAMPIDATIAVCAVIGVVVVAQSPAVVVAIRSETGADGPVAQTVLAVVVLADLLVIVLFAITSSIATAVIAGSFDAGAALTRLLWELFGSLGIGAMIGVLLALWQRAVKRGLDLFVLTVCFVAAEVGQRLHLDPLLMMLAAGMFVENVMHSGHELRREFEAASLPVYVLFFTVAGASIHLDAIPTFLVPTAVLVLVRGLGLLFGTRVAARVADAPEKVVKWAGFGLLPQAGLAIALALLFARTFPTFGAEAGTLVLGIVAINELVAPALLRWAYVRSGEAESERTASEATAPPVPATR
ncbi:cation:proton antiporter [Sandaracinus amylolyticus]|uniref:Na(+)/H(+) antiporter n=1 Tax=Sandaracinus amylolyticus TaxID=927083 RepID=A0A0F6W266_9BACT|nr:cation:proton antiporter [Sandaracinus amylolyticus]AKF05396.1 Na(+)/H(+) antiporter [Sandaracinus amylolyticus]